MEFIPVGLIFILIWLLTSTNGITSALTGIVALMPFGMLAAVNLPAVGGLSLTVCNISVGLLVVWITAKNIRSREYFMSRVNLSVEDIALLFLAIYAVFSATINVRIFQGDIDVFSLGRGVERSGKGAIGMLNALEPRASNISQPFYFLLSVSFFYIVLSAIRNYGLRWVHHALILTASLHILLSLLDFLSLDNLLSYIRTANYALLAHHEVHGFSRIIGGFAEPSAFGTFSSVLLAYFALHSFGSCSRISIILSLLLSLCVIISFSSSAYFGTFFILLFLAWVVLKFFFAGASIHLSVINISWFIGLFLAVFLIKNFALIEQVINTLIFDKASSNSGQERGLWSLYGFKTFVDTYGLGAGVGSILSNGWAGVYLGSMGIMGTIEATIFWYRVLVHSADKELIPQYSHIYTASKAAVLCAISMKFATATTPNPGLLLMFFAAIIISCRFDRQVSEQDSIR